MTELLAGMAEELHELSVRLGKLENFINGPVFLKLDDVEQVELRNQARYMGYYKETLARRVHRLAGEIAYP